MRLDLGKKKAHIPAKSWPGRTRFAFCGVARFVCSGTAQLCRFADRGRLRQRHRHSGHLLCAAGLIVFFRRCIREQKLERSVFDDSNAVSEGACETDQRLAGPVSASVACRSVFRRTALHRIDRGVRPSVCDARFAWRAGLLAPASSLCPERISAPGFMDRLWCAVCRGGDFVGVRSGVAGKTERVRHWSG